VLSWLNPAADSATDYRSIAGACSKKRVSLCPDKGRSVEFDVVEVRTNGRRWLAGHCTITAMTTRDKERTKPRRLFSGGLIVYQQVAAVIAAFALIALSSTVFGSEWRGFIATLVGQWNEYVRPAMKWLLHLLVSTPLGWLGLRVEVPLWIRDYLGVGLALALSWLRVYLRGRRSRPFDDDRANTSIWKPWKSAQGDELSDKALPWIVWPPLVLLVWPLVVGSFLFFIGLSTIAGYAGQAIPFVLAVAPVLYFGLLLAVNYLVL
jgi:hypothetical protein